MTRVWNASHQRVRLHRSRHDGAGGDDRALADRHAAQDRRPSTDPGPALDDDGLTDAFAGAAVRRADLVTGGQDRDLLPEVDVVLDDDRCRDVEPAGIVDEAPLTDAEAGGQTPVATEVDRPGEARSEPHIEAGQAQEARPHRWERLHRQPVRDGKRAPQSRFQPAELPTRRVNHASCARHAPHRVRRIGGTQPGRCERSMSSRRALSAISGAPAGLTEAVAHRAHGLDQTGVLLAQLGPQASNVDVDGPGAAVVLVAPQGRGPSRGASPFATRRHRHPRVHGIGSGDPGRGWPGPARGPRGPSAGRAIRRRAWLRQLLVAHGGPGVVRGPPPDAISTDLHRYSIERPVVDLPTTMSRYLALGLSLGDVVSDDIRSGVDRGPPRAWDAAPRKPGRRQRPPPRPGAGGPARFRGSPPDRPHPAGRGPDHRGRRDPSRRRSRAPPAPVSRRRPRGRLLDPDLTASTQESSRRRNHWSWMPSASG